MADLRDALLEMGCTIEDRNPGGDDEAMYVEHCGEPVSAEASAGGIFGPDRVWCEECDASIARTDIGEYAVTEVPS